MTIHRVSHEDFNWRVVKQYFRKNKTQLDALFSGLNKTSQSGSFYKIESTKYKVWDSNKGQFKDYSSKVKVRYSLDEQSQQILKEVTDAFKDLF